MSRQSPLSGIRDGRLRDLAKAASRQHFELGRTRHDHLFLRCGKCRTRITFSKTTSGTDSKAYPTVRTKLLQHGLFYQGRGGEHTAAPVHTS
ncbi:hypothetical protein ACFU99_26875 [Streptomyces sp. NPDC057654]|uniref:hypothetical protein n=1 Tax=Streptomyces sp. NPDC057654 TaxID=3346196 RepID=UPI00367DAD76